MKERPRLPKGELVYPDDIITYLRWLISIGLYDTADIQNKVYKFEMSENLTFEKMKHSHFWSKSSI